MDNVLDYNPTSNILFSYILKKMLNKFKKNKTLNAWNMY